MAETILQKQEAELVKNSSTTNLIQLAITNNAPIDTIERLMALYEREEQKRAFRAFHEDLSRFQEMVPIIKRNKKGYDGKYNYAELDKIVEQIKKPMRECGFTHRYEFKDLGKKDYQFTVDAIIEATKKHDFDKKKLLDLEKVLREIINAHEIEVTCIITHRDGHSERTTMRGPEDFSGFKNAMQSRGSTTSYLERYCLIGALGLVTADGDNDGGKMKPEDKRKEVKSDADFQKLYDLVLAGKYTANKLHDYYILNEKQHKKLVEAETQFKSGSTKKDQK